MNDDLLSCKCQAVAMANSEQPPLEKNGRKKGYIKIMREIWDAKGYGELGYTNQNLRDQAARIEEKSLDGNSQSTSRRDERMDSNSECQAIATTMSQENSKAGNYSDVSISISQVEYSMSQNAKNANSQETSFPDLHTINSNNVSEISGEIQRNGTNTPTDNRSENSSNKMLNDVPGCLPEYVEVNRPQLVNWNRNSDGEIITINSSLIDEAYTEITTWRKNTFLVPYGKTGRDFIDQLTKHIDDWNNGQSCNTLL